MPLRLQENLPEDVTIWSNSYEMGKRGRLNKIIQAKKLKLESSARVTECCPYQLAARTVWQTCVSADTSKALNQTCPPFNRYQWFNSPLRPQYKTSNTDSISKCNNFLECEWPTMMFYWATINEAVKANNRGGLSLLFLAWNFSYQHLSPVPSPKRGMPEQLRSIFLRNFWIGLRGSLTNYLTKVWTELWNNFGSKISKYVSCYHIHDSI